MHTLEQKLGQNTEELLVELYHEVLGPAVAPSDPSSAADLGRRWLRKKFDDWKTAICGNEAVRAAFTLPERERQYALATAVLDVIAGYAVGFTPMTVAALLVKEGFISLCEDCWK